MPSGQASKIKELRMSRGIKASFVAEHIGVSAPRYSVIENRKKGAKPSVGQLRKMAQLFGVPMEALVEADE